MAAIGSLHLTRSLLDTHSPTHTTLLARPAQVGFVGQLVPGGSTAEVQGQLEEAMSRLPEELQRERDLSKDIMETLVQVGPSAPGMGRARPAALAASLAAAA